MIRDVVDLINSSDGMTDANDVAKALGLPKTVAGSVLSSYARKGYLEVTGSRATGGRPMNVYSVGPKWQEKIARKRRTC